MQFRITLPNHIKDNFNRTATIEGMKTRVKEIYEKNQEMKKQMKEIIKMSGFKFNYIYDRLKMSSKTFDTRMKTGNWKDHEIEKLIEILHLD